jgi:hypothetical protein
MVCRGFIVWAAGIVLVLGVFLIFVAAGWPGAPDPCTRINAQGVQVVKSDEPPDTCYCEHFDVNDVFRGRPGVRQPVNTWSNLYLTSFLVAWQVWSDRKNNRDGNAMKRTASWLPDIYIFAVLFLGLGSMWLHAALMEDVSWMDGLSMYVFAGFLVFYSIYRYSVSGNTLRVIPRGVFFAIFYPLTVIIYTVVGQILGSRFPDVPVSTILIGTLVVAYVVYEVVIAIQLTPWSRWTTRKKVYVCTLWIGGVLAFGWAAIFRALSETGATLCDPRSFFQPHGLLWHPLAGVMAVLLYYFWREQEDR